MQAGIIFPLLLVLYEVAAYLSNDAYLPALPRVASDLATTHHLVQFTITTWFLGLASMQLILGPISDRYGRRAILLIGGVGFVTSTIACALAGDIGTLLIARFVQGATITSMIVAGYATIHELFDQIKAIRTLAWMNSITVLAPAFGPLFGAVILYFANNWRWIFAILAIWGALILVCLFFKMPETKPRGHTLPLHLKSIIQRYARILMNLNFMRTALSFCMLFAIMIAWIAAGPFLVMTKFHYNMFGFGIFQAIVFGSFILGTRMVKFFMNKLEITRIAKIGLITAWCGGLLSLTALIFPHALYPILISMILISFGSGLCFPILNRLAIESSSEPMGTRVGFFSALMGIFGMIGSGIISSFYNGTTGAFAIVLLVFSNLALLLRGVTL